MNNLYEWHMRASIVFGVDVCPNRPSLEVFQPVMPSASGESAIIDGVSAPCSGVSDP